jgi:Protein kinase domain
VAALDSTVEQGQHPNLPPPNDDTLPFDPTKRIFVRHSSTLSTISTIGSATGGVSGLVDLLHSSRYHQQQQQHVADTAQFEHTNDNTSTRIAIMGNCLDSKTKDTGGGGAGADVMEKSAISKEHHRKKTSNGGKSSRSGRSSVHSVHGGMLRERKIDVYKKYTEVEVLGTGSMGHVAKVQVKEGEEGGSAYRGSTSGVSLGDRKNEKKPVELQPTTSSLSERRRHKVDYALKSIQLDRVSPTFVDELKNEIEILKTMDHPNIVRLHEVYYHKKQIYLILELCDGGDLYTRLPYTEKQSAYITGKLLSAVKYMHDHGIVHRDCELFFVSFGLLRSCLCSVSILSKFLYCLFKTYYINHNLFWDFCSLISHTVIRCIQHAL